jgi:hypothetical protein
MCACWSQNPTYYQEPWNQRMKKQEELMHACGHKNFHCRDKSQDFTSSFGFSKFLNWIYLLRCEAQMSAAICTGRANKARHS